MPTFKNLAIHDLYIHSITCEPRRQQIFLCLKTSPALWEPISVGTQLHLPGMDTPRVLVLTDNCQPSWVQPETVGRLYKHITAAVDKKGKCKGKISASKISLGLLD